VTGELLSPEAFVERLRREGASRYHSLHPFNLAMHRGALSREHLQRWVLHRYYYQTRIPIKDALILSKSDDPAFRRAWMRRIADHDGSKDGEGGLAEWLLLARAVGLDETEVRSLRRVLPAVRYACDAYVELVRERSLVAPDIMRTRVAAWEQHYPWVDQTALAYFRSRVPRATRDAEEALAFVVEHATTPSLQEACVRALIDKCRVLWSMLDAVAEAV
jgi:pyrroloquinoline-quinone synthase